MVGDCRVSAQGFQFDRGLSKDFQKGLEKLIVSPDGLWLKDLLLHPDIIPAVRKDSLNFYYCGCSIFRVVWHGQNIVADTHYKYLLRQKQAYVPLDSNNVFEYDPKDFMWSAYKGPATLKDMMKAASVYAGPEKSGLHCLIKNSLSNQVAVIDVEVSFTRDDNADTPPEDGTRAKTAFDRLDVVTLEASGSETKLVFHEAKHFTNKELRTSPGKTPPVVEQLKRYQETIEKHKSDITRTYKQVRSDLGFLAALKQKASSEINSSKSPNVLPHPLLSSVGALQIDPKPRLIIFGFDQDQKKGEIWKKHSERLHGEFGLTIYAAGDPKTAKGAFASSPTK